MVTDNAQIFTGEELKQLSIKLKSFQKETSNQLVILTIQDLNNEPIEDYAYKTFEVNKIGQKNKDNGILLVIAKEDKKVRIEVGYGLEPIITDVIASRIIRNVLTPEFTKGNYFLGADAAINSLIHELSPAQPASRQNYKTPPTTEPMASSTMETDISSAVRKDSLKTTFGKYVFSTALMAFLILSLCFIKVSFDAWVMTLVGAFTNKVSFSRVFGFAYKTGRLFFLGLIIFTFMVFTLLALLFDVYPNRFFFLVEDYKWLPIPILLLITPLIFALMHVKYYGLKLNFALANNDTYFIRKEIESILDLIGSVNSNSSNDGYHYSSSGRSYTYDSGNEEDSNSNSNSYAGGGGRSGGGGASGSW
ncbi:YgcG family protein [Cellulophaga sp. E6(2014)]|uniref:TPM domain-containing protein n=1 Tax=Cellulophaga sp. E6(2014) TaxID=1495334 RepID=UPI00068CF9DA|nr:TPM domain-containing protein [Cellulophaga sp. E6(2014)]